MGKRGYPEGHSGEPRMLGWGIGAVLVAGALIYLANRDDAPPLPYQPEIVRFNQTPGGAWLQGCFTDSVTKTVGTLSIASPQTGRMRFMFTGWSNKETRIIDSLAEVTAYDYATYQVPGNPQAVRCNVSVPGNRIAQLPSPDKQMFGVTHHDGIDQVPDTLRGPYNDSSDGMTTQLPDRTERTAIALYNIDRPIAD